LIRYHASWIVPIAQPPIRDGWVAVDNERIVAYGAGRPPGDGGGDVDLGGVALLPGLVNAHTHLELSYLHNRVPPASQFVTWIRGVMSARREQPDPEAPAILDAVDRAIAGAIACGTAVVGDITNTLVTIPRLMQSPLAAMVFYELIRFNASAPPDADAVVQKARAELLARRPDGHVRGSLAAHAPYSVALALFRAIKHAVDREPQAPWSLHLAESVDELEFLQRGTGAWRALLEAVGAWDESWSPPRVSPVRYLDDAGLVDARLVAVHGVQMTPVDLRTLAARGATLVTCPRSNAHTGAGTAPIEAFYEAGVRVAVGTDSLASAPDLSVFAELAVMRALAPAVPAASLLESATRQGARALGFDADYGTIEPGKRAKLLAVDVPAGTDDVEEYLVSGVTPDRIQWIGPPEGGHHVRHAARS
jgi:cytosine/adenosine deaminase-related metal-dependent hydrolase